MPKCSAALFVILQWFILSTSSHCQLLKSSRLVQPEWEPLNKTSTPAGTFVSLSCKACGLDQENPQTAVWSAFYPGQKISKVELKETVWMEVPFWEIPALDTSFLRENHHSIRIIPDEQQKIIGSRIEIRLLREGKTGWEKLKSAKAEITYSELGSNKSGIPEGILSQPNSVFATGTWVKIGITKTGVYQIRHSDLKNLGLDMEGKSSDRIRMYGSGGKQLPEGSRFNSFQDISEIPIQIEDGGDGVFNNTDRIFFYGEDPNTWTGNVTRRSYEFKNNIYSDSTYYFITLSNEPGGKRILTQSNSPSPQVTLLNYPERWIYAPESVNVLSLGRAWYADVLDFNASKTISFQTTNLSLDSVFRIRFGLMARSGIRYPFRFQVNGTMLNDTSPETVNLGSAFGFYGRDITANRYFKPSPGTSSLNISVSYQKSGNPESIGYINFIEATGWRQLVWQSKGFGFRSFDHIGKNVAYQLSDLPSDARIWDVSDRHQLKQMLLQQNQFSLLQDSIKEFFAFSPSDILTPPLFVRIGNQNLRGMESPDLLIVTHPNFLEQAYRLANFRRSHDKMNVEVVTHHQVYNEFSSGSQDITAIRNLAMHLYYKDTLARFRYLLLFGDCSFDYKNRVENNFHMMPTFQSPASLYMLSSYASDDYFGILAKNKSGWETNDMMDIGVGRLPAKNREEAELLVNKLLHYASSDKCLGNWRNRYTFVADNGDYCEHSRQANDLSESLLQRNLTANVKKIFIGAYERISGAGGITSPAATNDLISSIEKGNLIVNYTGHGGETVWADEFLFTREMIDKLRNYDRLSFFITATCDFGRHDNPGQLSGAESLLLNNAGGAIGVMTTGRPVGSANNFAINQKFYETLFKPVNGKPGRMGDAIREAKNNNSDKVSNRGFTLLGDPSAAFAFPEEKIEINAIKDTIRGLDFVEVQAEIKDAAGNRDSLFQGRAYATLYDRTGVLSIIDGEPCTSNNYPYQRSVLYNGSTNVKDGRFSMQFFVSGDVSYLTGNGRLSLYADDKNRVVDASGNRTGLKVGGLNPDPIPDNRGPAIRLFMNDTNFVNHGLTGENADLLVFLTDEKSGINATGLGLGHDLIAVLDDNETFTLNEFFENDEGSFTSGKIRFPLRGLSAGKHKIRVKVWDNFNNSADSEIYFEVGINGINNLIAKEIVIFPNPFTDQVFLRMESALAGENAQISIEVLSLAGQVIASKDWFFENSTSRPGARGEMFWDGRNKDGSKLPPGMYFCRINLKSDTAEGEFKIIKKLILVH